ncbi:hypothetical protein J2Y54_001345 [Sphingomonas sp. BE123]|uniref:nucleotidyltransferase domain-containing protein n=1 Tax=unclassified Sphingomonas TaxID=196159 RepID=UPI0028672766|nr:nucleotidyltransferase family protein [Sphingomonas sp. BE123]MDR6851852.1 hypothetical protein [Sphingomonas sp. BE123]
MAAAAEGTEDAGSFAYLTAACRWPDDAQRRSAIAAAASRVSDWDAVLTDARWHRVIPLVARALRITETAPPPVVAQAQALARRDAILAMTQASEAVRIGDALSAAGVDWIAVKGPALAVCAYGDVAAKASHDLDLLIAPHRRTDAFAALRALGYESLDGQDRAPPGSLDHVLKDSSWHHPERKVTVELHIRLFINRWLAPDIGLASARETVSLGAGRGVPTLARPDLLVYLALHGARTNWHRLKWIADFAAMLRATDADLRAAAAERARNLGVAQVYDSAILLAGTLFGSATFPAPPTAGAHARRLTAAAIRDLTAPHHATLRARDWDRQLAVYLDRIRFMPGAGYRLEELRLMVTEASSYAPDAPWWRRWTAPLALAGRFAWRKLAPARAAGTNGRQQ